MGSLGWARATASASNMLRLEECAEVARPEWWSDERVKALSARVVRAAPTFAKAHSMRAYVLSGCVGAWEARRPRSPAELEEAAAHFDRASALFIAPAAKAQHTRNAATIRSAIG